MARGETFVTCPHCGSQSRIPVIALQHNNYHCSRCGHPIPLTGVNMPGNNGSRPPARRRPKRPFQSHRRH